jgi:hypothetical protein
MLGKLHTITALTVSLMCGTSVFAQSDASPVGIMGLYKAANPAEPALDAQALAALDCSVHRSGAIGAAQGDIGLEQPNQFVLFACETSVLTNMALRAQLSDLAPSSEMIAMLEGDLMNFPIEGAQGAVADRQYVFKISYYNNEDPDGRDAELANLTIEAEAKADTYVTEAFVGVNHAIGMPTPDEVVMLYYDDPATGDRFRNANGDLLNKIGAFNSAHLVSTVYYVGQAVN